MEIDRSCGHGESAVTCGAHAQVLLATGGRAEHAVMCQHPGCTVVSAAKVVATGEVA